MSSISQTQRNAFDFPPDSRDEFFRKIFSFLDGQSLARAERVCKVWKQHASDAVWHQLYSQDFPFGQVEFTHWKIQYAKDFMIDSNIRSGKGRLFEFPIRATSAMSFDPHVQVLYCGGSTINRFLHKLSTMAVPFPYIGASKDPCLTIESFCFTPDYNTLFSCAYEECAIRIWDLNTEDPSINDNNEEYRKLPTLKKIIQCDGQSHQDRLISLCAEENELFSSALDGTFCIWDLEGTHLSTLKLDSPAFKMCCNESKLFLGLQSGTILVWNIQEKKWLEPLLHHQKEIKALHVVKDKLFSSSLDDTICMWDTHTGKCQLLDIPQSERKTIHYPDVPLTPVWSLDSIRGKLFGGGWRCLYVWDILTGQFLQKFDAWSHSTFTQLAPNGLVFNGHETGLVSIIGVDAAGGEVMTRIHGVDSTFGSSIIRIWVFDEKRNALINQTADDLYDLDNRF